MELDLSTESGLRQAGFQGFVAVVGLHATNCDAVPKSPGVYAIVRPDGWTPNYLTSSAGGWFKGKDPTIPESKIASHWVKGAVVLYLGKAGGARSSASLRSRIRQYMDFGRGKPIGHWGGRLIWQLADHSSLQVCWRRCAAEQTAILEAALIEAFKWHYGARPFANLVG